MTKNVRVVDESGNDYGTTYLRRAKGLVKTGRARFTGENEICLARPPKQSLEDYTMSDEYTQGPEGVEAAVSTPAETGPGLAGLTINDVLSRIDRIISDTEHLKGALKALEEMNIPARPNDSSPAQDIANQAKAMAIADVVKSREESNRTTLGLLEKMYDFLEERVNPDSHKKIREFSELVKALQEAGVSVGHGEISEAIAEVIKARLAN